jgi:hypothetical protein
MNELLLNSKPSSVEYPPNSRRYLGFVTWGVLVGSLKIPDIQREVNEEWVKKLSVSLQESYDVKGYYQLGRFHLCCYQGELYLIDGQHRYNVLMKWDRSNIPIEFVIEEVETQEGMNELFMQINASRPSVICRNSNHQLILNGLRRYFQSNYAVYLKTSRQPHRPHLQLDSIIEKIEEIDVINKLGISHPNELIEKIEELNNYYRLIQHETEIWKEWKIKDIDKVLEKIRSKSPTRPMYFGIYVHNEWLQRLIKRNQDPSMGYAGFSHYPLDMKRTRISKTQRNKVWRKTNVGIDGECYVCKKRVSFEDFDCGHVKAVFWGGTNELDNLYAICRECNLDMGVKNLEDYKRDNKKN